MKIPVRVLVGQGFFVTFTDFLCYSHTLQLSLIQIHVMKQFLSVPVAFAALFFLFSSSAFSQVGATISLSGKIKPDQPVSSMTGVTIAFVDPSGKENRSKVDKDGNFSSIILNPATNYKVKVGGASVLVTSHDFSTPTVSKFTELKQDFTVMTATAGREIFKTDMFITTKTELSQEGKKELDRLIELLKNNRGLSVKILLPSENEPAKVEEKKVSKKSKKKSKEVVEAMPVDKPASVSLNQQRINLLQEYLKDVKSREKRVSFVLDVPVSVPQVATQPVKKGKSKETKPVASTLKPITVVCSVLSMETI